MSAPQGLKLVPVEPTPGMCAAWPTNHHGSGHEAAIYRAMLAAAPAAPAPALVPLTDAQWLKLWTGATGQRLKPGIRRDTLLQTLRFAERAYGIGATA